MKPAWERARFNEPKQDGWYAVIVDFRDDTMPIAAAHFWDGKSFASGDPIDRRSSVPFDNRPEALRWALANDPNQAR